MMLMMIAAIPMISPVHAANPPVFVSSVHISTASSVTSQQIVISVVTGQAIVVNFGATHSTESWSTTDSQGNSYAHTVPWASFNGGIDGADTTFATATGSDTITVTSTIAKANWGFIVAVYSNVLSYGTPDGYATATSTALASVSITTTKVSSLLLCFYDMNTAVTAYVAGSSGQVNRDQVTANSLPLIFMDDKSTNYLSGYACSSSWTTSAQAQVQTVEMKPKNDATVDMGPISVFVAGVSGGASVTSRFNTVNVRAGEAIVVENLETFVSGSVWSISDTNNDVFTNSIVAQCSAGNQCLRLWTAIASTTNSAEVVTVTVSVAQANWAVNTVVYDNVRAFGAVGSHCYNAVTSATTNSCVYTTTAVDSLVLCLVSTDTTTQSGYVSGQTNRVSTTTGSAPTGEFDDRFMGLNTASGTAYTCKASWTGALAGQIFGFEVFARTSNTPDVFPQTDGSAHNSCSGATTCTVTLSTISGTHDVLLIYIGTFTKKTVNLLTSPSLTWNQRTICTTCVTNGLNEYFSTITTALTNEVITVTTASSTNIYLTAVAIRGDGQLAIFATNPVTSECTSCTSISLASNPNITHDSLMLGFAQDESGGLLPGPCCTLVDQSFVGTAIQEMMVQNITTSGTYTLTALSKSGAASMEMLVGSITDPTGPGPSTQNNLCQQGISAGIIGAQGFIVVLLLITGRILVSGKGNEEASEEMKVAVKIVTFIAIAILAVTLILAVAPAGGPC